MGLNLKKLFIADEGNDLEDVEAFLKSQQEFNVTEQTTTEVDAVCNTSDIIQINSVYEENNLTDHETSIFKIDEIRNVLPKDLTKDAKRESVIGMMKVTGLSLETVLLDAENRKTIIESVNQKFTEETNKIITESNDEIVSLEERIEHLKSVITDRKKSQEEQEEILSKELEKIDEIVNFIK